jgi:LytS/YehU family sensor histidine kinase
MAWYMNDYARQRRAAETARQQQAETELSFLRSQLAPHFLFNTLNNIYALTLKESSAAPEAMLKLSAILRSLLYESGSALVPFEKEAEVIQAYIDLELLRLKNVERMSFKVHADGDYLVPPLLWLPVLENIFKHGTRIISNELFVDFSFTITEGMLTICGKNYCKAERTTSESEGGIGLDNLQRRLALLYPGQHTFQASYSDHVFTTRLTVKLS